MIKNMMKRTHLQIFGYCDVDWVGSPMERHSTTGYCVLEKERKKNKEILPYI